MFDSLGRKGFELMLACASPDWKGRTRLEGMES